MSTNSPKKNKSSHHERERRHRRNTSSSSSDHRSNHTLKEAIDRAKALAVDLSGEADATTKLPRLFRDQLVLEDDGDYHQQHHDHFHLLGSFFAQCRLDDILIDDDADHLTRSKQERLAHRLRSSATNNRVYAIKFLEPEIVESEHHGSQAATEMILEVQILASLSRHANIAGVYGIADADPFHWKTFLGGEEQLGFFYVTDWISETLADRMISWRRQKRKERQRGLANRLEIALDIASALLHIHTYDIVVYIRPDKLGFDSNGTLKVFGVGQAQKMDLNDDDESCGCCPSSIRRSDDINVLKYTAPELFRTDSSQTSTLSSDVYGFAILLWEIYTLRIALAGYTRARHYQEIVRGSKQPVNMDGHGDDDDDDDGNGNENEKIHWDPIIRDIIESCVLPASRPSMSSVHRKLQDYLLSSIPREQEQNDSTSEGTMSPRKNTNSPSFQQSHYGVSDVPVLPPPPTSPQRRRRSSKQESQLAASSYEKHFTSEENFRHEERFGDSSSDKGTGQRRSLSPAKNGTEPRRSLSPAKQGTGQRRSLSPAKTGTEHRRSLSPGKKGTGQRRSLSPGKKGTGQRRSLSPAVKGTGQRRSVSPAKNGTGQRRSVSPAKKSPLQRNKQHSRSIPDMSLTLKDSSVTGNKIAPSQLSPRKKISLQRRCHSLGRSQTENVGGEGEPDFHHLSNQDKRKRSGSFSSQDRANDTTGSLTDDLSHDSKGGNTPSTEPKTDDDSTNASPECRDDHINRNGTNGPFSPRKRFVCRTRSDPKVRTTSAEKSKDVHSKTRSRSLRINVGEGNINMPIEELESFLRDANAKRIMELVNSKGVEVRRTKSLTRSRGKAAKYNEEKMRPDTPTNTTSGEDTSTVETGGFSGSSCSNTEPFKSPTNNTGDLTFDNELMALLISQSKRESTVQRQARRCERNESDVDHHYPNGENPDQEQICVKSRINAVTPVKQRGTARHSNHDTAEHKTPSARRSSGSKSNKTGVSLDQLLTENSYPRSPAVRTPTSTPRKTKTTPGSGSKRKTKIPLDQIAAVKSRSRSPSLRTSPRDSTTPKSHPGSKGKSKIKVFVPVRGTAVDDPSFVGIHDNLEENVFDFSNGQSMSWSRCKTNGPATFEDTNNSSMNDMSFADMFNGQPTQVSMTDLMMRIHPVQGQEVIEEAVSQSGSTSTPSDSDFAVDLFGPQPRARRTSAADVKGRLWTNNGEMKQSTHDPIRAASKNAVLKQLQRSLEHAEQTDPTPTASQRKQRSFGSILRGPSVRNIPVQQQHSSSNRHLHQHPRMSVVANLVATSDNPVIKAKQQSESSGELKKSVPRRRASVI